MRYVEVVDLATGRAERVARGDVAPWAATDLDAALRSADADTEPPLGYHGYHIHAIPQGRCVLLAI